MKTITPGVQPVVANDTIASHPVYPLAMVRLDGRLIWVDC